MRIKVESDLHLEFEQYKLQFHGEDLLILAGDISDNSNETLTLIKDYLKLDENVQCILILGNHDYYSSSLSTIHNFWTSINLPRFHFLQNNSVIINNIMFYSITLWTDMNNADPNLLKLSQTCLTDYHENIKIYSRYLKPIDTLFLHKCYKDTMEKELANNMNRKIIMITHHLPLIDCIHEKYKNNELNLAYACTDIHPTNNIPLWIYGHTHSSADFIKNNTRYICNPRGKCGENTEFKSDYIINI